VTKLERFFTSDEIAFLKQYAQQHQLKEDEAVIALAREMIGTYSMKFVNGQTVLTMLDLLATKMPVWMNLQLGALKQSYLNIRTTAQSIKNLEHPTLWEEIITLLKDPQLAQQAQSFISGITSAIQGFVAPGAKSSEQEKGEEEEGEFI